MQTLLQAIEARGLKDPVLRSAKWHQAMQSRQANPHKVPAMSAVSHRALVEAQAPGFTFSQAVEPGDEIQFSSRGLTDWYVREFERLNNLKRSY